VSTAGGRLRKEEQIRRERSMMQEQATKRHRRKHSTKDYTKKLNPVLGMIRENGQIILLRSRRCSDRRTNKGSLRGYKKIVQCPGQNKLT